MSTFALLLEVILNNHLQLSSFSLAFVVRKLLEKRRFSVTQSCWILSDLRSLSDLLEKIVITYKTDHEFDILLSVRHDCGMEWTGKKIIG